MPSDDPGFAWAWGFAHERFPELTRQAFARVWTPPLGPMTQAEFRAWVTGAAHIALGGRLGEAQPIEAAA